MGILKHSWWLVIGCVPIAKARQTSKRKFVYPLDFWFRVSIISFQRSEKGAEDEAILHSGAGSRKGRAGGRYRLHGVGSAVGWRPPRTSGGSEGETYFLYTTLTSEVVR